MDSFQQLFDSVLKKQIRTVQGDVIRRSFGKVGIDLSDQQLTDLLERLESTDDLGIELEDEQVLGSKIALPGSLPKTIKIEFSDAEADEIVNRFSSALSEAIPATVEESANIFVQELRRRLRSRVKAGLKDRKRFEKTRVKLWNKPFELLEFFLLVVIEIGGNFNDHYRETAAKEGDLLFEVLTRLHARACKTGSEVMVLMRSGFADGAHARWRTLHEIAVVSIFIAKHGKAVAERYVDHDIIDSYKSAVQHQKYFEAMCLESIPEQEFEQVKTAYEDTVRRYGSAFKGDYGWAASVLGKERPLFTDIEANVDRQNLHRSPRQAEYAPPREAELERWRPYYKMASRSVHANIKGITKSLGLPPGEEHILLAGASDVGFADPGHGTAISLLQITTTMLTSKSNIDAILYCAVLKKLEEEIGQEFLKTHNVCEQNYKSNKRPIR